MFGLFILLVISYFFSCSQITARNIPEGYFHSDAILTKWPVKNETQNLNVSGNSAVSQNAEEPANNGWLKSQLLKFGQIASKIGNKMGAHSNKISKALDKICEVIKTVIPLLAAVCHVGQFQFCIATDEAPVNLAEAVNPDDLNLDSLDK